MEIWDVYDDSRCLTGKTHPRGVPMQAGENHVIVGILLYNAKGEILITRRSAEKASNPGKWESTAGCVQAGEDSRSGALRELREETGIVLALEDLALVFSRKGTNSFIDVYMAEKDVGLDAIVFQPGETCDARWISYREWKTRLHQRNVVFPISVADDFEAFTGAVKAQIERDRFKID